MALAARALEDDLALLLELVERRIGIGQRHRAVLDGVGQGAHASVREQHALKRRRSSSSRCDGALVHLRVIGERPERLLLQRRHASVQLVSTERVRPARPGIDIVGSGEGHVVDRRHGSPDVHERLCRTARLVAGSISLMFGGSGKVILTRPFCRRLLKSLALSPFVRKSSASIGRNSGSSASGCRSRRN